MHPTFLDVLEKICCKKHKKVTMSLFERIKNLKNCNTMLKKKQQKHRHHHQTKLTNMNILWVNKYDLLIKNK